MCKEPCSLIIHNFQIKFFYFSPMHGLRWSKLLQFFGSFFFFFYFVLGNWEEMYNQWILFFFFRSLILCTCTTDNYHNLFISKTLAIIQNTREIVMNIEIRINEVIYLYFNNYILIQSFFPLFLSTSKSRRFEFWISMEPGFNKLFEFHWIEDR